jgi:hypothetical protein
VTFLVLFSGVEYWTYLDPSSAAVTTQCAPDSEDPTCSAALPLAVTVVTPAHLIVCHIYLFLLCFC